MNKTLLKIINSREDVSNYLFHFTKGEFAFNTLNKIIETKALKDINKAGFICFTETPVTLLDKMFSIFNEYRNPMYAPYGIAIKKDWLFNLGARPVIYGAKDEVDLIDESMQWRFEEYIPNIRDFTWLREWRINKSIIPLDTEACFVITKTKEESDNITFPNENIGDITFDGCVADGQFEGYAYGSFQRKFKGISIDEITELSNMSKVEMENMLKNQTSEDTIERSLGSFIG